MSNTLSDTYKFFDDESSKVIEGIIEYNRNYSFSLSGNYSSTSVNVFTSSYPPYFPTTYINKSATSGFIFCTATSTLSSYYYHTLMLLYKTGATNDFTGKFQITGDLSSNTIATSANNFDLTPLFMPFDLQTVSSYTADYLYVFRTIKYYYGDGFNVGSFSAYFNDGSLFASDTGKSERKFQPLTIQHPSYTGVTIFGWLLRDFGVCAFYTPDSNTKNALTGLTKFVFDNSIYIHNLTVTITLNSDEFNYSENPSYYDQFYYTGKTMTPYITSIGLYNDKNDLLYTIKLAQPIKKYSRLPVTIKTTLDQI